MKWWQAISVPTQVDFPDIEYVNPAEAYRRQADAINLASPLYEELERVDLKLSRAQAIEREIVRRILAQHMDDLKSVQTRTNDLVDAFVLAAAVSYQDPAHPDTTRNLQPALIRARRRIERYERLKVKLERRLRALQNMADYCDRILNWAKHEARLEVGRGR